MQGFWQKPKKKNPKIVVSPTCETKDFKKEEMVWQQYLCMNVAEHQIPGGRPFFFGTTIRKDLVVEKGAISPEKVPLPMGRPAWRKTQVDVSQSRQSFASFGVNTSLA